ncbi:MAG: hypothetical protein QOF09_4593 [Alphaproteobacteria bacterium]|jgi:hypothetical protein|nr:hypothetical protein [Alphaproteobacteria bacterium]
MSRNPARLDRASVVGGRSLRRHATVLKTIAPGRERFGGGWVFRISQVIYSKPVAGTQPPMPPTAGGGFSYRDASLQYLVSIGHYRAHPIAITLSR